MIPFWLVKLSESSLVARPDVIETVAPEAFESSTSDAVSDDVIAAAGSPAW